MPNLLATDAVDRVRATIGDDHAAVSGAVPPAVVLSFLQTEYDAAWARMARLGVVPPVSAPLTGTTVTQASAAPVEAPNNVEYLAVVKVVQVDAGSGHHRELVLLQPGDGPLPFDDATGGTALYAAVYGHGADATVQLYPSPSDGDYKIYYVPVAPRLLLSGVPGTGQSLSIEGLPTPALDRVILGAARRCLIRTAQSSPILNQMIGLADEELTLHVVNRLHGQTPRIRNVDHVRRGWPRRGQDRPALTFGDPNSWVWLN